MADGQADAGEARPRRDRACDVDLAALPSHVYADSVTAGACRRCGWEVADHLRTAVAVSSPKSAAARGKGLGEKKREAILAFIGEFPLRKKFLKHQSTNGCRAAFTGSDAFRTTEVTEECADGAKPARGNARLLRAIAVRTTAAQLAREVPIDEAEVFTKLDEIVRDCPLELDRTDAAEMGLVMQLMAIGIEARTMVEEETRTTRAAATSEIFFRNRRGDWTDWKTAALLEEANLRRATTLEMITDGPSSINEVLAMAKHHPWRRDFLAGVAVTHRGFDTAVSIAGYWEDEDEVDVSVRSALKTKNQDDVTLYSKKKKDRDQATLIKQAADASALRRSDVSKKDVAALDGGSPTPRRTRGPRATKRAASQDTAKEQKFPKKTDQTAGTSTPSTPKTSGRSKEEALAVLEENGPKGMPFWACKLLGRCAGCGEEGHMFKACPTK
jgi:hypothetical protein